MLLHQSSAKYISANKKVMGGEPVIKGTRVPVRQIFDYLSKGWSVHDIVKMFPTVDLKLLEELISTTPELILTSGKKKEAK